VTLLIPIALILLGLALVVVEVYLVPGLNVIGVVGVIVAGAGVGYAFVEGGAVGGLGALAGTFLAGGALLAVLWRMGAWDRFVLRDTLSRDEADDRVASRARFIGQTGVAVSPLRPTGVADVGGERVEVCSDGAFIAAGSRIRVVAMDRTRFLVRMAEG
jgi:membrane-bound ClpP family serine protease